ncbi:hypothetical protein ACWFQT_14190 [Cellulosimicrobium cellulans]
MAWLLSLHPADHPRLDDACIVLGRAILLAGDFDRRCKWVVRVLDVTSAAQADSAATLADLIDRTPEIPTLKRALDRLVKTQGITEDGQQTLDAARAARNYFAHDVSFPLAARPPGWCEAPFLSALRRLQPRVTALARGANLVGSWAYSIEHGDVAPDDFTASYVDAAVAWVLDPVRDLLEPGTVPAAQSVGVVDVEPYWRAWDERLARDGMGDGSDPSPRLDTGGDIK